MNLQQDVLVFLCALVELARRAVWNVFRMEFEQYHNTGTPPPARPAPLAPSPPPPPTSFLPSGLSQGWQGR